MPDSSRLDQLQELLKDDPHDPFLRYGIALEHASAGDNLRAAALLEALIADSPEYVPAYLMAGQILAQLGREAEAGQVLKTGIAAAQSAGNMHAAGEMQGLLATLE